jgi:hypothetical protein
LKRAKVRRTRAMENFQRDIEDKRKSKPENAEGAEIAP